MKKIYYLLYLVLAVTFSACTHEEEDLFAESSAERADAAIKADLEVLTSPTNGWLMEYFPATMQEYGGYNMIMSFGTDGKVKVASEIASPDLTLTSLYSIKQSAGTILSFDTYNDIFHAFSDPSAPLGGDNGYGFEGDYDFLILEATAEKVVLKGKKTGGYAILTPMQGDWAAYITSIHESEASMNFPKYELQLDGQSIGVSISYRTLTFSYKDADGNALSQTASYIVTPTGYKFYEPIEINGKVISGFTYDASNIKFNELADASIVMVPIIPPINEQFVNGDWFVAYSQLGAFGQTYFAYCKKNYLDALGEELQYAFMGSMLYGSFGFNFSSSGYQGLLGYDYELIGENQIAMGFNFTGQGNGVWYYNNAGFHYLLNPFGYSSPRVFTLTYDDLANPTYITLTEDANPNNSITLFKAQIFYPFNN